MPRSTSWGTLLVPPSRVTPEDVRRKREKARETERIRQRIERDALEEKEFLECVALNPGISSKEVYRALGIKDNTKGGDIRDVLKDGKFIVVQRVKTLSRSGKWVARTSLSITPEGETHLQQLHEETHEQQTAS